MRNPDTDHPRKRGERLRVLFLCARLPYPLDTGAKIRAYHLLRTLAMAHDVDVLAFEDGSEGPEAARELEAVGVRSVRTVGNRELNRPARPLDVLLAGVLGGLPAPVRKYATRPFEVHLRRQVEAGYDVIHCEHVHLAHYLVALGPRCPSVMDAHNVEHQIVERMVQVEPSAPRRLALRLHARSMRAYERDSFRLFDRVLAVSGQDAEAIGKLAGPGPGVEVIENGVDTDYFSPGAADEERSGRLVFVGSMDWKPNEDGVVHFVERILPLVREKRPDAEFWVVGRNPSPALVELQKRHAGVVVTGGVDDVRPFVAQAEIVVVPLRFGGGTRLKVLEAFSMAKAVVSTPLGCEGIACRDGEHLLLGEIPEILAEKILSLLGEEGLRRALGERARELVLKRYAWQAVGQRLLGVYEGLRTEDAKETEAGRG